MSLRKAINAMCRDCAYDPRDNGSAAQQIACCTAKECSLYAVRPVKTKGIPITLLEHWNMRPADLDYRARVLVKESPKCTPEAQNSDLLAVDGKQTQPHLRELSKYE